MWLLHHHHGCVLDNRSASYSSDVIASHHFVSDGGADVCKRCLQHIYQRMLLSKLRLHGPQFKQTNKQTKKKQNKTKNDLSTFLIKDSHQNYLDLCFTKVFRVLFLMKIVK